MKIWENYELIDVSQYVNVTCEGEDCQFEIIRDGNLNLLEVKKLRNILSDEVPVNSLAIDALFDTLTNTRKWDEINDFLLNVEEGECFYTVNVIEEDRDDEQGMYSYTNEEEVELRYEILANNFSIK